MVIPSRSASDANVCGAAPMANTRAVPPPDSRESSLSVDCWLMRTVSAEVTQPLTQMTSFGFQGGPWCETRDNAIWLGVIEINMKALKFVSPAHQSGQSEGLSPFEGW
jgi:hypothetical protein